MNLLFSNDKRGDYPQSWYAASADLLAPFAPLGGVQRADVCVVGGGYTGLSAALHLAEAGLDVVLLEAHRVGFGASGRNGGQLGSGQRLDQLKLEKMLGAEDARRMWEFGEEAKALVRGLVERHGIDCHLRDGVGWAGSSAGSVAELHDYAAHMDARYGYGLEVLDREAFAALCRSPDFQGGVLDMGAAHLHPLRLALGLAEACVRAGVRIYERSHVHHIQHGSKVVVQTDAGRVEADHLILGCNGYLGGLDRKVAARVMPINNFIVATEPLGDRAAEVLTRDVALCDDRFVVNYWKLSDDKRLLFGGGESYGYRFPSDIRAVVRKPLAQIYPHLADVKLEYAWGGTLAITMKRLPHLARVAPNVLSASGYSGHGVGNAVQAGKLMAEAVRGQASGFDAFAALPTPAFPGGAGLRTPLLALAMSWFALRDKLGL
ncbi:NAD(P)/FAD-dependent oxidoreductase [Tropicibacter naphthalenivorans]|uniref:Gamma-glutamylputrescine oxidoreductase n=1 Tax=Tropicibacter naphthalenivorans TaxID=441103 RepID=A0A0P1G3W7_9RHOB|nr:FAD-binding oxidoreductase [Tropicibacter naphthalenivorans]CUH76380.1 Gamma-glutamylputrescine oxidoreductase [Tropicibacter naphthalenivorans]SMC66357.1 gamma-glutamylputrescine oxidase [Tropicibacter naphthalenivorans]